MSLRLLFSIVPGQAMTDGPLGWCSVRGDLGCLAEHAKAAGYRADDLAGRLNVPSRTLRRKFADTLGISLKDWLVEMRSLEVRRRLRGAESIHEIALSVGFSHTKEFSREFLKVFGETPTSYRNRERNASVEDDRETGQFPLDP